MSNVISDNELQLSLKNVFLGIKRVLNNVNTATFSDGTPIKSKAQTIFGLKFSTKPEQALHEIIVSHALNAEKYGPGSFCNCVASIVNSSDLDLKSVLCHRSTACDLENVITYANLSKKYKNMLRDALDLVGFAGKILVEDTNFGIESVELVSGYVFSASSLMCVETTLEHAKIVCIDGFIETVSELHRMLEELSETKQSAAIIVRGMSDDVKHTLKVNYDRGTLRVVPVQVDFDLRGINTLSDIAAAAGGDVISSHKGQLLTNVKIAEQPTVQRAVVYNNRMVIFEPSSRASVANKINFLSGKRSEATDETVVKLYDERVRSLTPNHAVMRLRGGKDIAVVRSEIDNVLRTLRSLVQDGVVVVDGIRQPAAAVFNAVVQAKECIGMLGNLGAIITP